MIEFVPYTRTYLDKSYMWLQDAEIRKLTDTQVNITKESQQRWYESIQNDDTYQIWGIAYAGIPIGTCGIKHIDYNGGEGEYWAYIGEKKYWGGKGHSIVAYVCNEAKKFKLKKLYLRVLKDNVRAYNLYLKEGFVVEQETQTSYKMIKVL